MWNTLLYFTTVWKILPLKFLTLPPTSVYIFNHLTNRRGPSPKSCQFYTIYLCNRLYRTGSHAQLLHQNSATMEDLIQKKLHPVPQQHPCMSQKLHGNLKKSLLKLGFINTVSIVFFSPLNVRFFLCNVQTSLFVYFRDVDKIRMVLSLRIGTEEVKVEVVSLLLMLHVSICLRARLCSSNLQES